MVTLISGKTNSTQSVLPAIQLCMGIAEVLAMKLVQIGINLSQTWEMHSYRQYPKHG